MTPEQFLRHIQKQGPAPVYLFAGPDLYYRDQCRRALLAAVLSEEERADGFVRHDLDEEGLDAVLDDARTLSLFAGRRLIWASSAEGALPRGRTAAAAESDEDDAPKKKDANAPLAAYVRDPTPETVVVFDSSRYAFDGEDRARMDRLLKFYAAIPNVVEFHPPTREAALALAQGLAREAGLKLGPAEAALLVETLGSDASRLAVEIEKLRLYAGVERPVQASDIAQLTPNTQENSVFELVAAMGAGNRVRSLDTLDSLVRDGVYLPLALSFLGTQFRMALMAREAGLRSAADIQNHFSRVGVRIWRDRAEQIRQTLTAFPQQKLAFAVQCVYQADRAIRDTHPDDRTVMEELILKLTGTN